MREERGQLRGDQVIGEAYTLWGSIAGNATAIKGSKFYVRGTVYGDLDVLVGGRVDVVRDDFRPVLVGGFENEVVRVRARRRLEDDLLVQQLLQPPGVVDLVPQARVHHYDRVVPLLL